MLIFCLGDETNYEEQELVLGSGTHYREEIVGEKEVEDMNLPPEEESGFLSEAIEYQKNKAKRLFSPHTKLARGKFLLGVDTYMNSEPDDCYCALRYDMALDIKLHLLKIRINNKFRNTLDICGAVGILDSVFYGNLWSVYEALNGKMIHRFREEIEELFKCIDKFCAPLHGEENCFHVTANDQNFFVAMSLRIRPVISICIEKKLFTIFSQLSLDPQNHYFIHCSIWRGILGLTAFCRGNQSAVEQSPRENQSSKLDDLSHKFLVRLNAMQIFKMSKLGGLQKLLEALRLNLYPSVLFNEETKLILFAKISLGQFSLLFCIDHKGEKNWYVIFHITQDVLPSIQTSLGRMNESFNRI